MFLLFVNLHIQSITILHKLYNIYFMLAIEYKLWYIFQFQNVNDDCS